MPANIGSGRAIALSGGVATETRALLSRITSPLPAALDLNGKTRQVNIDTLVRALVRSGVWSKLDILHVPAAHSVQPARLNWKSALYGLMPINSPTFVVDRGYAGDGSAGYLDTAWVPSTNGVGYTLNGASMGVYLNAGTNTANNSAAAMGVTGTVRSVVIARDVADHLRGASNGGATLSGTGSPATRMGMTTVVRGDAANISFYRNGALDSIVTSASTSLPAVSVFLGAINSSGVSSLPSDNRIAVAFAGANLSATEIAALYAAVFAYLTAIGAN
jgi:hypothetical protein